MYPSDYGYATAGGSTADRVMCMNIDLFTWDVNGKSDCRKNDYLFKGSYEWTLSSDSSRSDYVFYVNNWGRIDNMYNVSVSYNYLTRPVAYLKSGISISSGTGTSNSPYQLSVK